MINSSKLRSCGKYCLIGLLISAAACAPISVHPENPDVNAVSSTPSVISTNLAASPTIQQGSSSTDMPVTSSDISPSKLSIRELTPTLSSASDIINAADTHSLYLQQASPLTIALDDQYVYWVDHKSPRFLYRISQTGGTPEVAAQSLYEDGRLDCIDLQSSEHWLILCDTPKSKDLTKWSIRAINLDDLSQQVLLTDDNEKNLITFFDISLNENSVIWAIATQKDYELDENVITFVNLNTEEKHDVLRTKVDSSVWPIISLSGNQAVIEQDFDETQGGKSVLHLLDLVDGEITDLSMDGKSSMPDFNFPWVVWKQGSRYDFMTTFVIDNLKDGQLTLVPSEGLYPSDLRINGPRVFWTANPSNSGATNAIYIFDIEKNTTYALESPGPDQVYNPVCIHGNKIAWILKTQFSKAVSDAYLEWTTIR